jgi:GT2 family glycosyltransferase
MMSRASLEKVGLFDPAYFIFFDDWDLSARYRAHGYSIFFVPKARLWHKVSVSTKKTGSSYYMGKSSARFYLIHKSSFILILHSIWFVLREGAKMNFSSIRPFLSGVQKGVADYRNQK